MKTKKEERKVDPRFKRTIQIEFKGKTFPVELDETPHRHKDEEYEVYKERQKMVAYFKKMEKKEMLHKSLSYIDKMVGQKGITYKNKDNE